MKTWPWIRVPSAVPKVANIMGASRLPVKGGRVPFGQFHHEHCFLKRVANIVAVKLKNLKFNKLG